MRARWIASAAALFAVVIVACVGDSLTVPTTNCDAPNDFCNGACTDTQTDPRNCGACGKQCNTSMGETCQKGTCGPPCTGGTTRCGSVCLDAQNDPNNCGDCGKKCGAGEACTQGKCALLCRSGLNACPRAASPPSDAGAPPSDAGAPGDAGSTDAGAPPPPPSGSACVDFQTDALNCGKCGNVCPADKPFCDFGTCKLYKWNGVLTNVNQDDLSPRWTECFTDPYTSSGVTSVNTLVQKCPQANLLVACRTQGQKTLQVAAMAPRNDVLFDTGPNVWNVHIANGVSWYFDPNYSLGFAVPLDGVNHQTCDTAMGLYPDKRLCWHISSNTFNAGYRCGANMGVSGLERVVFQTP